MSHFIVSLTVWAKSQNSVHKPQFLKRKESRSGSNRGPSAYQPSALPLGHNRLTSVAACSFTSSYVTSPSVIDLEVRSKSSRKLILIGYCVTIMRGFGNMTSLICFEFVDATWARFYEKSLNMCMEL